MDYANLQDFKKDILASDPEELIGRWIRAEKPHAFQDIKSYRDFIETIAADWPESELIQIAGSGNWKYSLNPSNPFREFHQGCDYCK